MFSGVVRPENTPGFLKPRVGGSSPPEGASALVLPSAVVSEGTGSLTLPADLSSVVGDGRLQGLGPWCRLHPKEVRCFGGVDDEGGGELVLLSRRARN